MKRSLIVMDTREASKFSFSFLKDLRSRPLWCSCYLDFLLLFFMFITPLDLVCLDACLYTTW